jgi:hypothetical protein
VRGCLQYLQRAQIAEVSGTHRNTTITILNWSIYQNPRNSGGTPKIDDEGKQRAQPGQTKGKVGATIEQRNKETRKPNCFSGAGFTGDGGVHFDRTDKRFSAYEPQKPRFNGGDSGGVSELQSQNQSQNLSVKESQKQSQNLPPAEIVRNSPGETEQDSPKQWSGSEQAAVRERVCRLLPIEPEEGFEISLWYRVNHAPAAEVCGQLDRMYAKPAYRHPRGRWRLHHPNGILETLGNIFVRYHAPEPAAQLHADHFATADQIAAGIGAIELADVSTARRTTDLSGNQGAR